MSKQAWLGGLLAATGIVMATVVGSLLEWGAWRWLFIPVVVIGVIIQVKGSRSAVPLQSKRR